MVFAKSTVLALTWVLFGVGRLPAELRCDHRLGTDITKADGRTSFADVKPGDTVCLMAGLRSRLVLENFQGSEQRPIMFVNFGGRVVLQDDSKYGIVIRNSRYFRLTGSGSPTHRFGIEISGVETGVRAGWRSSDMEFDHLEIKSVAGQGILTSSKSTCEDGSDNAFDFDNDGQVEYDLDDRISQANFTQYNTIIHDNLIRDVGDEALYIGSNRTVYANYSQGSPTNCKRGNANPLHPLLNGVEIYSNVIQRTGRDAINVKGTPLGCKVHHNSITEDSMARRGNGQDGGIDIGLHSRCDVYENVIQSGFGRGLSLNGIGGRVYNNLITDPGRGFDSDDRRASGIHVHMGTPGGSYEIFRNTIVNPRSFGIRFTYHSGSGHVIRDNEIFNPGNGGDSAFIYVGRTAAPVRVFQNRTVGNRAVERSELR